MRLTLFIASSAFVLGHVVGCATSDPSTATADAAVTSNGGKSGAAGGATGGHNSGGASSGGGSSTGGKSPLDCPVDSGTENCRQCLAANCCTAYENCVRDSACSQALETYRQCANAAVSGSEKGACFATFSRSMKDAGASAGLGSAIGLCVYQSCIVCGASSI